MNRRTFIGTVLGLIAYAKSGFAWEHKPLVRGFRQTFTFIHYGSEHMMIKNHSHETVTILLSPGIMDISMRIEGCTTIVLGPFDPAIYNNKAGVLDLRCSSEQEIDLELLGV